MYVIAGLLVLVALALLSLAVLAVADRRADRGEWSRLEALQPDSPAAFSAAMVTDLPEPVRRFFTYAIQEGTPLLPVAIIEMTGQFSLGTKSDPRYQQMQARQILAAPEGFVWAMRTRGGIPVSGSDTARWTRFRIFGLIPVARMGGDADHTRSAFGRYVAEAVIWAPAALLPAPGVTWSALATDTIRVTVAHRDLVQAVHISIDASGRPIRVIFQRWSDANPERVHRLQPFGAVLSDFREIGGYRLPFHVKAGNMFGTDDYFPFFLADVTDIRFPGHEPSHR